ncbi:helix-turn-helix domain-containing protein [Shouchella clausii]|uniref:helix-turn-helix domain-containing protein n=1 Tax=Shouchella clausii TaxID=79880 RepID=UPI002E2165A4|nr:helix-turn-helix domain-containing protein [Shouchella clausii]MED4156928.1 helix-turn-helix domain-containing protein [Shouchella clausii]MED4175438.1 helix-turn-helix domain-containing protein [Shouchella clausii]
MESNPTYDDFEQICSLLNTVTKIDIRLTDSTGTVLQKYESLMLPSVPANPDNKYSYITERLHHCSPQTFQHHVDSTGIEYVSAGIWKQDKILGSIIVGPFISTEIELTFLNKELSNNALPLGKRSQIEHFYKSLPALTKKEYNAIGTLLVNLLLREHTPAQEIRSTMKRNSIKDNVSVLKMDPRIIRFRYDQEKKIMNAIATGNKKRVFELLATLSNNDLSYRFPDNPIRATKNITYVFTTLCRIAAVNGGVDPLHVHSLSERFALLIERSSNLYQLSSIRRSMVEVYCDAVVEASTLHYSPLIKKTINYIQSYLEEPLTLKHVAAVVKTNPTYLSRVFKEETNMNMMYYINLKRVEEAKLYLQGDTPITEIAFLVGFNDANYFSRVFKQIVSVTPLQYRKKYYR